MTVLIAVLAFTSVGLLTYSLVSIVPARPRALSRRLTELQHMGSRQDVLQRRKRQAKRERLAELMEAFEPSAFVDAVLASSTEATAS